MSVSISMVHRAAWLDLSMNWQEVQVLGPHLMTKSVFSKILLKHFLSTLSSNTSELLSELLLIYICMHIAYAVWI